MVVRSIARAISSLVWLLAGLVSLVVGMDLLHGESLSISISGNSANVEFAIGYVTVGALFLLEAALTFYGKKLALVLSIPVAVLMAVFVFDELGEFWDGSMVSLKYLSLYAVMLFASTLTSVLVAWSSIGAGRTNA
ncbi:hypothetical protein ACJO5Y_07645 [Marinobacter sp. GN3S48]|uniref:hypothetical protein n=1 Tax=Marinobacter sp. GN3S48 TaxID=3382302 RepID=UPI00387B6A4F